MKNKSVGVISVDNGGFSTVCVSQKGIENFPSVKSHYGERNLTTITGKYDFIVEYKNEKFVLGTLAKYDSSLPMQMHTRSKQNLFYDLSILTAIHQFGFIDNYLVTSVPIKMHTEEEKNGLYNRLIGTHTIKVNEISKTFFISDIKIAPETASAYWVKEPEGMSRWIDLGSRTVGYATTINMDGVNRYIDSESGTIFGKGLEALDEQYNPKYLADFICGLLIKTWNEKDKVYLLGGGALDNELVEGIKMYFPNSEVMNSPQLCNAIGMYNLGRNAYGMA